MKKVRIWKSFPQRREEKITLLFFKSDFDTFLKMKVSHNMATTANIKGSRISIPNLCSKCLFQGIRIYNTENIPFLQH